MQTFADIIDSLRSVTGRLPEGLYLGHTSGRRGVANETLNEHIELVNKYFQGLADKHGLERAVDRLITALVEPAVDSPEQLTAVGNAVKTRFVAAIAFHDLGKVNPNYQFGKLKNPEFEGEETNDLPFLPLTGHSELGAMLYVHYFVIEALRQKNKAVRDLLLAATLAFSYPVSQHHSKGIFQLPEYGDRRLTGWFKEEAWQQVRSFAKLYDMAGTPVPRHVWKSVAGEFPKQLSGLTTLPPFPLYALTKLNYSLLTASDYLATSDYMNQEPLEDFGVIDDELRRRITTNARTTLGYNAAIFAALGDPAYELTHPTAVSNTNLNRLRQEMAVEALRTLARSPDKRLYYLEAPTGGGKTNISMLVAARLLETDPTLNKLLYVFPFTTLATQTQRAMVKTYGLAEYEVAEIHGKAPFYSRGEGVPDRVKNATEVDAVYGRERRDHLRYQFFHFPVALVTHVRFFGWLTTNWKEDNYVYHRLAGSVVIVDELQAYDPRHWDKVIYFLDEFARYFNCRFVLMSATLPKLGELLGAEVEKPTALLPDARRYLTNPNFAGRVNFDFSLLYDERGKRRTLSQEKLAERVLTEAERYRQRRGRAGVFVIVEFIFKKSAGAFQRLMRADKQGYFDKVLLLSGTVLEHRRREIINYLKREENRDKKILLVTTQVVEAGVDLDMDLGFKHVSLPDSDEQLAGRVNRNVTKEGCTLWLFYGGDDPGVIYGRDYRYLKMREAPDPRALHVRVLRKKRFDELYGRVNDQIGQINDNDQVANLPTFKKLLRGLDFLQAATDFRLIDAQSESVFVPIEIPVAVDGEDGRPDPIFTPDELAFLERQGVGVSNGKLNGQAVFAAYLRLIHPDDPARKKEFIRDKNNHRRLAAIMSRFTFSLLGTDQVRRDLRQWTDKADNQYGYWVLDLREDVYSPEGGLDQEKFRRGGDVIM